MKKQKKRSGFRVHDGSRKGAHDGSRKGTNLLILRMGIEEVENIHCLNSHETSKVDISIISVLESRKSGLGEAQ